MTLAEGISGLGMRSDFIGREPEFQPSSVKFTMEELVLFALVGKSARISEVLSRSGLPEETAIAALLSLRKKGAIRPSLGEAPPPPPVNPPKPTSTPPAPAPPPPPPPVAATARPPPESVELPLERQKEILELEKKLTTANYFELLGLPPTADSAAAKGAYHQLSLKFHPDRYFGRELGPFRSKLDTIFRKLTEAQSVLSDSTRRATYLRDNPELGRQATPEAFREPTPEEKARHAERRSRLAKHPYLARASKVAELTARAKTHVAARRFDQALADLTVALQIEPESRDATQLLAEVRKRHAAERVREGLTHARHLESTGDDAAALLAYRTVFNMDPSLTEAAIRSVHLLLRTHGDIREAKLLAQKALEVPTRRADALVAMGLVLLAQDQKKQAKEKFEAALTESPEHAEAKKQLKKLKWIF